MKGFIKTILKGFIIGLVTAGVPGPVITLVITETLKHGYKAGFTVVLGPFTVDALVMIPLALVFQRLLVRRLVLVIIGLVGGGFLIWLGGNTIYGAYFGGVQAGEVVKGALYGAYIKGLIVQLFSPFAYLFWVTVGSLMIKEAKDRGGLMMAALFPLGFWLGALVITVVIISLIVKGRHLLGSTGYQLLLMVCGAVLIGFGVYFIMRVLTKARN